MRHTFMVRALFFLFLGTTFWSCTATAQSTGDSSVADAARRAREKKKAAGKPTAVITNDTLPAAPSDPATSVPKTDQSNSVAPSAPNPPPAAEIETPEDATKKKAAIEALKQEIAEKQKVLDIEQRELALDSDAYYSKPDFQQDKDGKAKLDALQVDLQQKQDEIAKLKAKLASLGAA
jgi:type IV secretory pathway TrbL component